MNDEITPGRMCDACEQFKAVHAIFRIVPGAPVRSICVKCKRDGWGWTEDGRVVRLGIARLQVELEHVLRGRRGA